MSDRIHVLDFDSDTIESEMHDAANEAAETLDCDGYVLVAWDADFETACFWCAGEKMPGIVMPEFVKQALLATIHRREAANLIQDDDSGA